VEVPDVAGKAMVRPEGCEEAPVIDEGAVAVPALDAKQVEVDAVLGIILHLPPLLHPARSFSHESSCSAAFHLEDWIPWDACSFHLEDCISFSYRQIFVALRWRS
jgi:hypothetical protein